VLHHLRADDVLSGPLVLGGRSAGARVACRTAAEHGAAGVLALAFPLHPPGKPENSRAAELTAVPVPLVVVQGETDAFGDPAAVAAALAGQAGASVYAVPGDHSLKKNVDIVAAAALSWLDELPAR
jgi:predicted alpha/beta-hydrolase family hydrolase